MISDSSCNWICVVLMNENVTDRFLSYEIDLLVDLGW